MNIEFIAWVGFSQGLFATAMMMAKRDKTCSDRVLAIWLLLLAIEFLTCAIDFRVFGFSILSSSFLLFNPAIYIYIKSLINKNFRLRWIHLLHLIPFIFFEIVAYISKMPFTFENFFTLNESFIYRFGFSVSTIISTAVYIPISIYYLHQYRMRLMNEKSTIEKGESLAWLYFVSIFYIVYSIVAVIMGFVFVFLGYGVDVITYYNYSFLLLLIYIISFYGIYQIRLEVKSDDLHKEEHESYKNSLLDADTKAEIKEKVIDYVEKNKAYLNPDINMDLLSFSINYPKYQITEVLNMEIGKNFFQFINSYRVEEVKKMLLEPTLKYSIEAIGYECGFNSKSSFYTVFKKMTGETPISFRNKNIGN